MLGIGVDIKSAPFFLLFCKYSCIFTYKNTSMDYKVIIKRRLKELHMTQKQLAEKVGLSENSITSFLKGKSFLSFANFIKVVDALDMQIIFVNNEDLK